MNFGSAIKVALSFLLSASAAMAQMPPPQKELIKINIEGPSPGYFLTYVAHDLGLYRSAQRLAEIATAPGLV